MSDAYETFDLVWQDRRIAVSFQSNWLNSNHWHIELRCDDRLPVTDTGYCSHFLPSEDNATEALIRDYVLHWLEEAAKSEAWKRYLEDSRQLKLF